MQVGPYSWYILCLCFFAGMINDSIIHLVTPCPMAPVLTWKHCWSCASQCPGWVGSLTSFPGALPWGTLWYCPQQLWSVPNWSTFAHLSPTRHPLFTPRFFFPQSSDFLCLFSLKSLVASHGPQILSPASFNQHLNISPNLALHSTPPDSHHSIPHLPRDTHSSWKMFYNWLLLWLYSCWNFSLKCWSLLLAFTIFQSPDQMPSPLRILILLLRLNCSCKLGVSGMSRWGTRQIVSGVSPVPVHPTLLLPKWICFCSTIHTYPLLGNVTLYP